MTFGRVSTRLICFRRNKTLEISADVSCETKPHPIARATVKLLCDERKVRGETKTDSNGEFVFFNLKPRDDITIRFTHPSLRVGRTDYEVRAGFDSTYETVTLEHCPRQLRSQATSQAPADCL